MLVGLALLPVAGVIALAAAPGGIDGQVSEAWDKMTNPDARTPANTPDRLTATSSVRARYWDEAFKIHADQPWRGAGAGAYVTARTRHRTGTLAVRHAHGYLVQTLADLGWAGFALSLAALAAWLAAALPAVGLRPRDRGLSFDAERVGLFTMVAVVIVFGVHSFVDWTWFVPANAAVGLLCAAWVVGRGPLRDRLGAPAAPPDPARPSWWRRLTAWRPHWYRAGAALAILATSVAAAWATFQPVRAVHAGDAAIERAERGALDAAASIARIGSERNPLSVEPLWELAYVEDLRGNRQAAQQTLERAVHLQPASAEAWRRLGEYRLLVMDRPREALEAYRAAYYLDPRNPTSTSDFLAASRALKQPR
jgi:tetratricopeptide (TPR) repeat protein